MPTSYKVAAPANVAMWPPTLVVLFALVTMTAAFHRTIAVIRSSSSRSPGNSGSAEAGIVLM